MKTKLNTIYIYYTQMFRIDVTTGDVITSGPLNSSICRPTGCLCQLTVTATAHGRFPAFIRGNVFVSEARATRPPSIIALPITSGGRYDVTETSSIGSSAAYVIVTSGSDTNLLNCSTDSPMFRLRSIGEGQSNSGQGRSDDQGHSDEDQGQSNDYLLITAALLGGRDQDQYIVTITCQDLASSLISKLQIAINIVRSPNIAQKPEFTQGSYTFQLPVDSPVGTFVGRVSASPSDRNSFGLYSLLSRDYQISASTGIITTTKEPEPEVTHTIALASFDNFTTSNVATANVTIILIDTPSFTSGMNRMNDVISVSNNSTSAWQTSNSSFAGSVSPRMGGGGLDVVLAGAICSALVVTLVVVLLLVLACTKFRLNSAPIQTSTTASSTTEMLDGPTSHTYGQLSQVLY